MTENQNMTLSEILRDSNYKLTQFSEEKIKFLEENIFTKDVKGKTVPYVKCLVRKKDIKLTPEEVVRQLYILVLNQDYGYPIDRMELEYAVSFGREKKRADIVIFDKDQTTAPYIMVELKKPKLKDGKNDPQIMLKLMTLVILRQVSASGLRKTKPFW